MGRRIEKKRKKRSAGCGREEKRAIAKKKARGRKELHMGCTLYIGMGGMRWRRERERERFETVKTCGGIWGKSDKERSELSENVTTTPNPHTKRCKLLETTHIKGLNGPAIKKEGRWVQEEEARTKHQIGSRRVDRLGRF